MSVNGKSKGSAWEREVSKKLSCWITGTDTDVILWRTASSGGRATQEKKKGNKNSNQAGDIGCISPEGAYFVSIYMVECKFYKDLSILPFIMNNAGTLAKFWIRLEEESRSYHKHPILIAKQNRLPPFIISTQECIPVYPEMIEFRNLRIVPFSRFLDIEYNVFTQFTKERSLEKHLDCF